MNLLRLFFVGLLVLTSSAINAFAQSDEELLKRLQALEQEVAILKRELEIRKEEETKKATEVPVITASAKDGFSIKNTDESFKLKIRGLLQADSRFFTDNKKDLGYSDTFSVRRARPIFEGTVGKIFDFYLMPDFGSGQSTLVDAFAEFRLSPAAKIRGGKFKAPFGLERLQSDAVANFTEIGLPSNLAPNREVGFQLSGDVVNETVNYAVGIFNGSTDVASTNGQDTDNNNDKDIVGRLFTHPFKNSDGFFKGLGFGIAGSYGHKESSSTPSYRSSGQATIFSYGSGVLADGPHVRYSPQAYFYQGSFGVLAEYIESRQKVVRTGLIREFFNNKAWQVSANYVLTGELASYKGITPLKSFDWEKKQWGAFELTGRLGKLDLDESIFDSGFGSLTSSVSAAKAWALGFNWYPHKNVRMMLSFEQTRFEDGGPVLGEDRKTENAIFSRFQLSY